jgi:hypothetical protein
MARVGRMYLVKTIVTVDLVSAMKLLPVSDNPIQLGGAGDC